MEKTKKDKKTTAVKRSVRLTSEQKKLQKAIKDSAFVFGQSAEPFVPVYGPFAWVPESKRYTMHAAGGASLEGF